MSKSYKKFKVLLMFLLFIYFSTYVDALELKQPLFSKREKGRSLPIAQVNPKPLSDDENSCQLKCDNDYGNYKVKKCCNTNPQFQFGFKKQNYMIDKSVEILCFEVLTEQPDSFGYIGEVNPSGIQSIRRCAQDYKPLWQECRTKCEK